MEKLIPIEQDRKDEIVSAAIERDTHCVLTTKEDGEWRVGKSQMVGGNAEAGYVAVHLPQESGGSQVPSMTVGDTVGVTFRRGHKKCMFSTTVISGQDLPAESKQVALAWPQTIQELQRRAYQRAKPGRRVRVRFWQGGVAARASVEEEGVGIMDGTLLDLSAGGMRIIVGESQSRFFKDGDSVGCALTAKPRGQTFVLDAVFRHEQSESDGTVSFGVQFVGLETSEAGRNTLADLARIVTDYQRAESRPQRKQLAAH